MMLKTNGGSSDRTMRRTSQDDESLKADNVLADCDVDPNSVMGPSAYVFPESRVVILTPRRLLLVVEPFRTQSRILQQWILVRVDLETIKVVSKSASAFGS